ncbi:MAG TPA: serine hydrolase domain-containing protein [Pseudonocardia sp.]|jgi:CubicO group peptidase (beta-lactamase class C family)|nr:serine hydrolase domain-containing protein [Pseudonocardia sp.]
MTQVQGTVRPDFDGVRAAFEAGQRDDPGLGQLCVYLHGEPVVDLWTGEADALSVVMSCSKGVTATCAHLLAQRGELDLDTPVAHYWPEFAAAGKAGITVSDLLSHRAGLSGFTPDSGVGGPEMLDWSACTKALAAMAPLWEPGTAMMYHSVTFGWLVGEVIRRVSGRSVGTFLADEIAGPLGLDLWIGLPAEHEPRVVPQTGQGAPTSPERVRAGLTALGIDLGDPLTRVLLYGNQTVDGVRDALNSRAGHAAEVPAANGIGNARSLARLYAAIIGEVDGVRLLDADTVAMARVPQTELLPAPAALAALPDAHPLKFGLGYELSRSGSPQFGPGSFGHSGAGGRLAFAHPESGLAVGYVCTNMSWDHTAGPDPRWLPWTAALHEAVAASR